MAGVAGELCEYGYNGLARLLASAGETPLLVVAVRYFFRREVETDTQLYQGLTWTRMENLGEAQEKGFAALTDALAAHGQRLEELLGDVRDVVIETRVELLGQPEFQDPRRLRELLRAVEAKQRLLEVLDQVLEGEGVCVAFGEELDEPALRDCALVASRYGEPGAPLGVLGVIGPSRMNYPRVIPLVRYLSEVITGKLGS